MRVLPSPVPVCQNGDIERALLHLGNIASTDDWRSVLVPVIEHYGDLNAPKFFQTGAAFAIPQLYELLEVEEYRDAIRLKTNAVLERHLAHLLTRPVGRFRTSRNGSTTASSTRAKSWTDRVAWWPRSNGTKGELFPRTGFIVTDLGGGTKPVVDFYNRRRGTAKQVDQRGQACGVVWWARLPCHGFNANQVRLQLHVLAYNLGNFLRWLGLPASVKHWTPTTLREKLLKIGAKMVRHARYVTFQLAEAAVPPRGLYRAILRRTRRFTAILSRAAPNKTGQGNGQNDGDLRASGGGYEPPALKWAE